MLKMTIKKLIICLCVSGFLVSCSIKKEYDSVFFKAYMSSVGYIQDYPNEGEVLVCEKLFSGGHVSSTKIVQLDSSILLENLYKKDMSIKVDVFDSDIFFVLPRSSYGTVLYCNMQIVFSDQDTVTIGSNNLIDLRSRLNSKIVEIIIPRFGGTVFKGSTSVKSKFHLTITCDKLKREVLEGYWFGDFEIKDIDTFNLDVLTVENAWKYDCAQVKTVARDTISRKTARRWFEP